MDIKFSNDDWNIINRSTVYSYSGKKVKSHTIVFIVTMILITLIITLCVSLAITDKMDNKKIAILFLFLILLVVVYIVKRLQFDTIKVLTQYYVDENKDCYKIKFAKVSTKVIRIKQYYSLIPLVGEVKTFLEAMKQLKIKENYMEDAYKEAPNKALSYYYVKCFKQGIKDWNWFYGGEAKVIYLGKIDNVHIPKMYKS